MNIKMRPDGEPLVKLFRKNIDVICGVDVVTAAHLKSLFQG